MQVVEAIFWKMRTFLPIQIRFKTKNWSCRLLNNNDNKLNMLKSNFLLISLVRRPVLELLQYLFKIYSEIYKF